MDNLGIGTRDQNVFMVDYKRIIDQSFRYWYWIVLSLVVCLSVAFLRNRYAKRIYTVTASVIIKETEETSGAELLYKNSLLDPHRNYLNELYIIKSYPLVERVLKDLNFEVSFFQEGKFLTSEYYDGLPISAKVVDSRGKDYLSFYLSVDSQNEYTLSLSQVDDETPIERHTFRFGQTIEFAGIKLLINANANITPGSKILVVFQHPRNLVGGYVGGLSVQWAEEGAGVINLSISGPTPQKDIDFLKGLIKQYQLYDLDKKNQTASRTIEFINKQLGEIADSLQRVESQMESFKKSNVVSNNNEEVTRMLEKLDVLESERSQYLLRKNYYDYITKYISNSDNVDPVIAPSSVGIEDPILGALIGRMIDLQLQMKANAPFEKRDNPLVVATRTRLADLRSDILEAVRNLVVTDKVKSEFSDRAMKVLEGKLNALPASERKYISIKRNYSLLENLYVFLLQKQSEASISKASNTTDIIVVNEPMQEGGPISPNTTRNYAIALLIGFVLPIAVFIFLEFFNNKIQSKEDVDRIVKLPFIGGIGHEKSKETLAVLNSPKSALAESFRSLRANLSYFLGDKTNPVVVVSSSISGEGKTFTTINLGSIVALSGKKTLIVGADMRRPKLFKELNLSNETGLSSYLAGMAEFSDIVQPTAQDNLYLVGSGPIPPNPAELLLGERIKKFLDQARKDFEYIIIDTPPMALVTDAVSLAELADHTVFVVRQDYTPRDLLTSLRDYHSNGRIRAVSILLNDINKSGLGYGYGYGYGYGHRHTYGRSKNGYGYYTE